jgi:signal transduction histidine kinase
VIEPRLLAELLRSEDQERARVAVEIHDDAIQAMTAAGLRLDLLLAEISAPGLVALLSDARGDVDRALATLRDLVFDLGMTNSAAGLGQVLRERCDRLMAASGTTFAVDVRLSREPGPGARALFLEVFRETVVPARRRAPAQDVDVHMTDEDDGILLSVSGLAPAPGHPRPRTRDRVESAGGWLRGESSPAAGATMRCWLPYDALDA